MKGFTKVHRVQSNWKDTVRGKLLDEKCFFLNFCLVPLSWSPSESRLTTHGVYVVTHNLSLSFFKLFCRAQPIKLG